MQTYEYYETRAKQMPMEQLLHAIRDVKETLEIWKSEPLWHPYVKKLYAEFDAYTPTTLVARHLDQRHPGLVAGRFEAEDALHGRHLPSLAWLIEYLGISTTSGGVATMA